MIKIKDKDYTIDEIEQVFHLCRELLEANELVNAQLIACMAKLSNEELKTKKLTQKLYLLSQAFTNNTYNA